MMLSLVAPNLSGVMTIGRMQGQFSHRRRIVCQSPSDKARTEIACPGRLRPCGTSLLDRPDASELSCRLRWRFELTATALIVEGHPLFRGAMIQLVRDALPDITPVAASSAEEGLRVAATLTDVRLVLLDAGLPGMNGAEAIAAFCKALLHPGLMALSSSAWVK
jgi:hypothetical protein